MPFTGQSIIVTGGTRGIGEAITRAFLEASGRVIATFRRDTARAKALHEALPAEQAERLRTEALDAADFAAVERFFTSFRERGETVQVLVNNAGIRDDAVLAMMTPEQWQRVIDTNLGGTFNMSRFAVQEMMPERYGRIVNVTSPSGQHGFAGQANYAASKAGQVALARSLAREVATRGITVNCVSPGYVDTELLADLDAAAKKAMTAQVPMRRFGKTTEVGAAVLFLASREASYITGATLDVTGGY